VGPTSSPVQWVQGTISKGTDVLDCDFVHSLPSNDETKVRRVLLELTLNIIMEWC
jgi:hypothetical protein